MAEAEFRAQATRGVIWNYLYKFAEFGLINIYSILVVRHFGPAISAPYAIFLSVSSILTMVGAFAVDGVLLRFIQQVIENPGGTDESFESVETLTLPHFLTTLFSFRLLTILAVSLGVVLVIIGLPNVFPTTASAFGSMPSEVWWLILFLFAQAIVAFSTFALTGLLETKKVFIASLVARIVLIAGGLLLLQGATFSTDTAIMVYVGSSVICAIMLFFFLRQVVHQLHPANPKDRHLSMNKMASMIWSMVKRPKQISVLLATPLMLYGITTWGNSILSMILGKQSDVMVMGMILGEHSAQIGYYQAASTILLVTEYIFLFGFGGTLVSIFSKLAHNDETASERLPKFAQLAKARHQLFGYQNVLLLPLCFFVLFFCDDIVNALYGQAFAPAGLLIRIGVVALVTSVGFFGGGMQITTLVSIGKEGLVFRNRLFWGSVNLIANIGLIYYYGAIGALIGTQYANLFAVASEWYFARKYVGDSTEIQRALLVLIISAAASAMIFFAMRWGIAGLGSWLKVVIAGCSNALLIIVLYRLFRVREFSSVLERIGLGRV